MYVWNNDNWIGTQSRMIEFYRKAPKLNDNFSYKGMEYREAIEGTWNGYSMSGKADEKCIITITSHMPGCNMAFYGKDMDDTIAKIPTDFLLPKIVTEEDRLEAVECYKDEAEEYAKIIKDESTSEEERWWNKGRLWGAHELLIHFMTDKENQEYFNGNPNTDLWRGPRRDKNEI